MIKLSYKKLITVAIIAVYFLFANALQAATAQKTLLVFGDSLVAGYRLSLTDAFPAVLQKRLAEDNINIKIINAGVSGDTTSGGLTRLEWTLEQNADFAILELGANDMMRGIDPQITYDNLDKMLEIFNKKNIPVLLAGMKARPNMGERFAEQYRSMYKELAQKHHAILYPFFLEQIITDPNLLLDDGMHPNEEGVSDIVENILPLVKELIGEK